MKVVGTIIGILVFLVVTVPSSNAEEQETAKGIKEAEILIEALSADLAKLQEMKEEAAKNKGFDFSAQLKSEVQGVSEMTAAAIFNIISAVSPPTSTPTATSTSLPFVPEEHVVADDIIGDDSDDQHDVGGTGEAEPASAPMQKPSVPLPVPTPASKPMPTSTFTTDESDEDESVDDDFDPEEALNLNGESDEEEDEQQSLPQDDSSSSDEEGSQTSDPPEADDSVVTVNWPPVDGRLSWSEYMKRSEHQPCEPPTPFGVAVGKKCARVDISADILYELTLLATFDVGSMELRFGGKRYKVDTEQVETRKRLVQVAVSGGTSLPELLAYMMPPTAECNDKAVVKYSQTGRNACQSLLNLPERVEGGAWCPMTERMIRYYGVRRFPADLSKLARPKRKRSPTSYRNLPQAYAKVYKKDEQLYVYGVGWTIRELCSQETKVGCYNRGDVIPKSWWRIANKKSKNSLPPWSGDPLAVIPEGIEHNTGNGQRSPWKSAGKCTCSYGCDDDRFSGTARAIGSYVAWRYAPKLPVGCGSKFTEDALGTYQVFDADVEAQDRAEDAKYERNPFVDARACTSIKTPIERGAREAVKYTRVSIGESKKVKEAYDNYLQWKREHHSDREEDATDPSLPGSGYVKIESVVGSLFSCVGLAIDLKGLSVKEAISLAAESTCGKQIMTGGDLDISSCPAVNRCLTGVRGATAGAAGIVKAATSWISGALSSVSIVHVGCKGREIRSTDIFATDRVKINEPTDRYAKAAMMRTAIEVLLVQEQHASPVAIVDAVSRGCEQSTPTMICAAQAAWAIMEVIDAQERLCDEATGDALPPVMGSTCRRQTQKLIMDNHMEEPEAIETAMRGKTGPTMKMKNRYDECVEKAYTPLRIDAHCACLTAQVKKKVKATEQVPLAGGGTKTVEGSDQKASLGAFQTTMSSTKIGEDAQPGMQFVVTGDGDRMSLPLTEDGILQRATITQCHPSAKSSKYMLHVFTAHSVIETTQTCKRKDTDVMRKLTKEQCRRTGEVFHSAHCAALIDISLVSSDLQLMLVDERVIAAAQRMSQWAGLNIFIEEIVKRGHNAHGVGMLIMYIGGILLVATGLLHHMYTLRKTGRIGSEYAESIVAIVVTVSTLMTTSGRVSTKKRTNDDVIGPAVGHIMLVMFGVLWTWLPHTTELAVFGILLVVASMLAYSVMEGREGDLAAQRNTVFMMGAMAVVAGQLVLSGAHDALEGTPTIFSPLMPYIRSDVLMLPHTSLERVAEHIRFVRLAAGEETSDATYMLILMAVLAFPLALSVVNSCGAQSKQDYVGRLIMSCGGSVPATLSLDSNPFLPTSRVGTSQRRTYGIALFATLLWLMTFGPVFVVIFAGVAIITNKWIAFTDLEEDELEYWLARFDPAGKMKWAAREVVRKIDDAKKRDGGLRSVAAKMSSQSFDEPYQAALSIGKTLKKFQAMTSIGAKDALDCLMSSAMLWKRNGNATMVTFTSYIKVTARHVLPKRVVERLKNSKNDTHTGCKYLDLSREVCTISTKDQETQADKDVQIYAVYEITDNLWAPHKSYDDSMICVVLATAEGETDMEFGEYSDDLVPAFGAGWCRTTQREPVPHVFSWDQHRLLDTGMVEFMSSIVGGISGSGLAARKVIEGDSTRWYTPDDQRYEEAKIVMIASGGVNGPWTRTKSSVGIPVTASVLDKLRKIASSWGSPAGRRLPTADSSASGVASEGGQPALSAAPSEDNGTAADGASQVAPYASGETQFWSEET